MYQSDIHVHVGGCTLCVCVCECVCVCVCVYVLLRDGQTEAKVCLTIKPLNMYNVYTCTYIPAVVHIHHVVPCASNIQQTITYWRPLI